MKHPTEVYVPPCTAIVCAVVDVLAAADDVVEGADGRTLLELKDDRTGIMLEVGKDTLVGASGEDTDEVVSLETRP